MLIIYFHELNKHIQDDYIKAWKKREMNSLIKAHVAGEPLEIGWKMAPEEIKRGKTKP